MCLLKYMHDFGHCVWIFSTNLNVCSTVQSHKGLRSLRVLKWYSSLPSFDAYVCFIKKHEKELYVEAFWN